MQYTLFILSLKRARYMNLGEIKQKYKSILQQPESEQSEEQWEVAYSRMKNKRRKHILTESNTVNHQRDKRYLDEDALLKVKQKLAQCLTNLARKDVEIAELKHNNLKIQEQVQIYQKQVCELKQALAAYEQKVIQSKIAYGCIEKDYENLSKNTETQKLSKQLMKKQIAYFESEMKNYEVEIQRKAEEIERLHLEIKNCEKYKMTNRRLKVDGCRLRELLAETQKYKKLANALEYKHYLGRCCKEHECWFSQDLISSVQNFMRKEGIGKNNQHFFTHLLRFVSKHVEDARKKVQKRSKRVCSSRIKRIQRKHNHSLNLMDIRQDTLQRSMVNSMCKSGKRMTLNGSKRCTESFIYDRLEKSLLTHQVNDSQNLCAQMLSSFKKGLMELISGKQIKRKKIMRLSDWLAESILSMFPSTQPKMNDIQIEIDSIK